MSVALDDVRWLVSDAAAGWLELSQREIAARREPTPAFLTRLRKELSAERAHLVVEQIELRCRAVGKFALAERMFFTRKALEQATDELVAAYKAERFPSGEPVLDLCCGIGGDLLALARRAAASGVERDAATAVLAEANAEVCGLARGECRVVVGEVLQSDVATARAWHCDPDRRVSGKKTARVEFGEPTLAQLEQLLSRNSAGAIKMAPAAQAPANWTEGVELEWIGSRGECRQQVAWFGILARHPGRHSATIVDTDQGPHTVVGTPGEAVTVAPKLGRYLFEPDAAVLAAKLSRALAEKHGLLAISGGIAYLTGERMVHEAALDAFEILEVLPLDRKQLRAYCREHQIGRLEVKKRGVEVAPERLRKEIVAQGDREATILIAPVDGQVRAMVARRVDREV